MSENVGASTSRNPEDLHGLYSDNFNFLPLIKKRDLDTYNGRNDTKVYCDDMNCSHLAQNRVKNGNDHSIPIHEGIF
jgi:hypothetical protein